MADNTAVLTGPGSEITPGWAAEVPADTVLDAAVPDAAVLVQDLLVEEVSIDGMCGVY